MVAACYSLAGGRKDSFQFSTARPHEYIPSITHHAKAAQKTAKHDSSRKRRALTLESIAVSIRFVWRCTVWRWIAQRWHT